MWGIRQENILAYKSKCYIASKLGEVDDGWGNLIPVYDEPKPYLFNIQNVTSASEMQAFGELVPRMKVATIPKKVYNGMFKEYDLAYLDGVSPENDVMTGENANYRIYSVQPQNAIIKVYFITLVKGEIDYENEER